MKDFNTKTGKQGLLSNKILKFLKSSMQDKETNTTNLSHSLYGSANEVHFKGMRQVSSRNSVWLHVVSLIAGLIRNQLLWDSLRWMLE